MSQINTQHTYTRTQKNELTLKKKQKKTHTHIHKYIYTHTKTETYTTAVFADTQREKQQDMSSFDRPVYKGTKPLLLFFKKRIYVN